METEEKSDVMGVLEVVILVVAVAIVAPIVTQGMVILGTAIINALQPKQYEMTLTYEDGSTETKKGTKKELEKWLNEKQRKVVENNPEN